MFTEVMDYRMSVRQLVAVGLLIGVPYLVVGLIWAFTHTDHLGQLDGLDQVFSFIGEVVAWPPLVISDISLR